MLFAYIQYTFINDDQWYINIALQVVNCLLMLCLQQWNIKYHLFYLHRRLAHVIKNSIAQLQGWYVFLAAILGI